MFRSVKTLDELAVELQQRRRREGLSVRGLSELSGVSRATIKANEEGSFGNVTVLGKHLDALGLELRWVRRR